MGILFLIALCIAIFLLLLRLLKFIALLDYRYYRIYMQVYEAIFYNMFIRYVIQSTLKLQVAAVTTLTLVDWLET